MPPAAKGDKALATLENHLLARGLNALLVNTMTPIGYQAIYEHTGPGWCWRLRPIDLAL